MDEDLLQKRGYRYCEYQVVLNPHEDLRNRITRVRKDFNPEYGSSGVSGGKPHVLIAKFIVWEMMEARIVNRLRIIAMGMPAFKVILKDFGTFPSHTIFINVITKIPIQHLVKEVRRSRQLLKSPDHDPYFNAEPYISIARKISPSTYEKAWLQYSSHSFSGSFIADAMLLLKRADGEKVYQVIERLDFMNLPVTTTQGDSFS